jgi:multiple sugar transport system ATP-binding protein
MKAGVLQQLGAPQHLYDHPDNIFVAGFIGSPPMNMAIGRVDRTDAGVTVTFGGATIQVPESVTAARPALASYAGRDVAVGIRSEDMEDAALARDAGSKARLTTSVALTEALGSEIVVHFPVDAPRVVTEDTKALEQDAGVDDVPVAHDGNIWVASFSPRSRVRPRDQVEIAIDQERLHFFDPETGLAIRD